MDKWLFTPPLVFLIIFFLILFLSSLFSWLAWQRKDKRTEGAGKAYACGEDVKDHLAQPDYSQFFPFAFFFTIAHVATLMMTTVPSETAETLVLAVMYISVVVVGLIILLRK
jgi:NADH-quinone oxidoreductase subunit A